MPLRAKDAMAAVRSAGGAAAAAEGSGEAAGLGTLDEGFLFTKGISGSRGFPFTRDFR